MADLSITAEGYGKDVQKKEFNVNYWPQIYAARQNNTIMQETATAVETHRLNGENIPCLVVMLGSIKGLIPIQESGCENKNKLRNLIGQKVAFKVVTFDRDEELVLLSRSRAIEHMSRVTWERLEEGKTATAVARVIYPKTAELDIGGIRVNLPVEEFSWGWTDDLRDHLQEGDAFDVKLTNVDKENKQVTVSLKALLPCPWPDAATRYQEGNEYLGVVSGVEEFGVFVNLEPGVDALAPQMKFGSPQKGDRVLIRIIKIKPAEHKINARIIKNLVWRRN